MELRALDRWTRADGKRPITLMGRAASSTRPGTWSTYQDVKASTAGDGIGVMLGDGLACIDLDHAIGDDGALSPLAVEVLALNPGAWVERSRSSRGLHVFGLLPEGPGVKRPGIEVYSRARFIRVTGDEYRAGRLVPLVVPEGVLGGDRRRVEALSGAWTADWKVLPVASPTTDRRRNDPFSA